MSPIIALPGTLLDDRSLRAALAGLNVHHEVLGTGDTLTDELDRLARLAGGPVWWVGHSLGGIVALQMAVRHPERVAGLVLLAANARGSTAVAQQRRDAQWQAVQKHGLRALAQLKLGPGYGLHDSDTLVRLLADQAEAVGVARFGRQLAYANQRPSLADRAPWIRVPVLALSADGDSLCPPGQSDEIIGLVAPGSPGQHHVLEGAGHLFPMQHSAWVATRLRLFMSACAPQRMTR